MSCATRHPHLPPVPLSSSVCLHCTLHTLRNPHALPTLRRAAVAALSALNSSPQLALSEPTMMHVLRTLSDTLFHSQHLQNELLPLCAQLAVSWDLSTHGARAVLITSCINSICRSNTSSAAILLLSALLPPSPPSNKHVSTYIPQSSAESLSVAVLRQVSNNYEAVAHIMQFTLPLVPSRALKTFPALLEALLPPQPCDKSRLLYLQVATHLYSKNVAWESQTPPSLNLVLCTSFISSEPAVREQAANLLKLCHDKLTLSNIFEYLIEGLREASMPPLRSKRSELVKQTLPALSLLAPSVQPPHWCYALRTVFSIADYADGATEYLCQVIQAAVKVTPASVFASGLISDLVTFVMRLMNTEYLSIGAECLRIVLMRYKATVDELQAILGVVECLVEKQIAVVYEVIRCTTIQFRRLADIKTTPELLQTIGRRIILIIFDKCASQLEGKHTTIENIEDVLKIFTDGLDPLFLQTLSCSTEDRLGIQNWCWRYFPPRDIMKIVSDVTPLYLWRISTEPGAEQAVDLESLCTEEELLSQIAGDGCEPGFSPVFVIVDKAVQIHRVHDLCLPEAIVEALLRRLHSIRVSPGSHSHNETNLEDVLRIVRLMLTICSRNGLCFPINDIHEDNLQTILQSPEFSFNVEADRILLRSIIGHCKRGQLDVWAWDLVASRYRNPMNKNMQLDLVITGLITSRDNDDPCESIIYAISNSVMCHEIVDCLLDVFERQMGYEVLYNAMQGHGAIGIAFKLLHALPTQGPLSLQETTGKPNVGYDRVISLLDLICCTGVIADSQESWGLLRIVCDSFTRESMSQLNFKPRILLLLSLVRCLIALLRGVNDHTKIAFIRHSGVESQAIKLLTELPNMTRSSGLLLSSITCLVNLFMQQSDLTIHFMPELEINMEYLANKETWEKLLTPAPGAAVVDETNSMANSCYLLESLLRGGKGCVDAFRGIVSRNTLILLHAAAVSWSRLLSQAAQSTFRTLLELNVHEQESFFKTQLFGELCSFCVSQFCTSHNQSLASPQISLLAALVHHGYVDEYLAKIMGRVSNWSKEKETSCDEPGEEVPSQTVFIEMKCLARALKDRLRVLPEKKLMSGISRSLSDFDLSFTGTPHVGQETTPDVLLGRYTMIWRAGSTHEPL